MTNYFLQKIRYAAATGLLLMTYCTHAAPYLPSSDKEVLLQLPINHHAVAQKLRQRQIQRANQPLDIKSATTQAKTYIELGGSTADPRYNGYAQAVLQPWWHLKNPSIDVLILRAMLRQRQHDFDLALDDLNKILAVQHNHAQALLTKAVIQQVQGHYAASKKSCFALLNNGDQLMLTACIANVASLNGQAENSYHTLKNTFIRHTTATTQEKLWVLTILADIATRLGQLQDAEQHYQAALRLDQQNHHLINAYSDFLLDQNRPTAANQLLIESGLQSDGVLLRMALAAQQRNAPDLPKLVARLKARFTSSQLRGQAQHLREQARFTLHLLNQPRQALQLALQNWQIQKEPADMRILIDSALANHDNNTIKLARNWLQSTQLEDIQIKNRLEIIQ